MGEVRIKNEKQKKKKQINRKSKRVIFQKNPLLFLRHVTTQNQNAVSNPKKKPKKCPVHTILGGMKDTTRFFE